MGKVQEPSNSEDSKYLAGLNIFWDETWYFISQIRYCSCPCFLLQIMAVQDSRVFIGIDFWTLPVLRDGIPGFARRINLTAQIGHTPNSGVRSRIFVMWNSVCACLIRPVFFFRGRFYKPFSMRVYHFASFCTSVYPHTCCVQHHLPAVSLTSSRQSETPMGSASTRLSDVLSWNSHYSTHLNVTTCFYGRAQC
jgi:hypothetical protein